MRGPMRNHITRLMLGPLGGGQRQRARQPPLLPGRSARRSIWPVLLISTALLLLALGLVTVGHFYWSGLRGGVQQMHAADDGMKVVLSGQRADILQRIDHAGMTAAEKNHDSIIGFDVDGLVIHDGVRLRAGFIEIKIAAGILEVILPRNLPGQPYAIA